MALNDRSVVLDVLPKGSAFLDFMVELGHLNENLVQKINQKLLRIRTIDGQISLEDVRRIVQRHELTMHIPNLPSSLMHGCLVPVARVVS